MPDSCTNRNNAINTISKKINLCYSRVSPQFLFVFFFLFFQASSYLNYQIITLLFIIVVYEREKYSTVVTYADTKTDNLFHSVLVKYINVLKGKSSRYLYKSIKNIFSVIIKATTLKHRIDRNPYKNM